jgi:hypothetical protein
MDCILDIAPVLDKEILTGSFLPTENSYIDMLRQNDANATVQESRETEYLSSRPKIY